MSAPRRMPCDAASDDTAPSGPATRRRRSSRARLEAAGWTILARNVRRGPRRAGPGRDGPRAAARRSSSSRCAGAAGATSGSRRRRSTTASARALRRAIGTLLERGTLPGRRGRCRRCRSASTSSRSTSPRTGGRRCATTGRPSDRGRRQRRRGRAREGPRGAGPVLHSRPPRAVRGCHPRPCRHAAGRSTHADPHPDRDGAGGPARRAARPAPAGDPRRHQPQEVTQCPPSRCASCLRQASTLDTRLVAGTRR